MKKLFKSIALATVASGALLSSAAMAADQKIAVVNFQEVMGKIPQTAAVMQSLEAEFKDAKAELAQLEKDIKYYQEKKTRDSSLMSAKEIEELDKKIATFYQDYQIKGKDLQQKAGARQNEETNKIVALVRQAIDGIAAKGNYDLVLEQKAVVFAKPDTSITEQVVEQVSKIK
ncbi:OmpH family outer membrane protein [Colwellia sp. 1_MG-2023]|uniref:OmpH family outer membrane protein n=1 Tax=Colwellia sp. 1_MG-2023 TaxID=3062649 RepID=UPI0026E37E45|nr:OmpH family outer membrane protein [Colwellia sp. 1_MG-2023]MDO6446479.1 OmpH family outer membrane protein [Colwellia sp. 1_MG-2023]